MRRFAQIVLSVLVVAMLVPAAYAENYALLIGASDYRKGGKSGLTSLKYPKNDIVDFGAALVECGYKRRNVVLMYDGQADNSYLPEYAKIQTQFDLLLKDLTPEDSVIVALAGHGVQFVDKKVNYYCPLDADPQNPASLISLTDVYERLHECQASRKMLLVDACRNDAVSVASRSSFARMELESVTRPQVDDVPDQIIAIFSCSAGQQSWEDDTLKHGIFFAHILKGLSGLADAPVPDGRIKVEELAEYVSNETKAYARVKLKQNQTPIVKNEGKTEWLLRTLSNRVATTSRPLAEANRLRIAGELAAAREAYNRAILAEPKEAKAYLGRGLVALAMDDTPMALSDFQQAVRLDPTNASAWTSLGGTQGRAGKFADAIASYSEALKLAPVAAAPLAGRGAAQVELGRIDLGLKDLNRALKIEPDFIDALYNRARAHQKRGDTKAERRDLERARALESPGR
jgi:uncharacterized caspase-like protein